MDSGSKVLPFIRDNLDSIIALVGAIFSLILITYLQLYIGLSIFTVTAVLVFLACATYLVLKQRRKLLDIPSILDFQATPSILLLADIVFFVLFIYSLWSFVFSPEPYVRPLGYFISIAAMSAILAAKILFLPSKNSPISFTLFQIILIALSLRWSVLLLFPSIVGLDTWVHQLMTLDMLGIPGMLTEGYVGYSVQGLPVMYFTTGSTMLITGLSYKMAAMFSVSLLQVVCDLLFIFLIGRLLFNAKIGMLAALLVGIANWHIFFGYWSIPNSLGATFIIIILYVLLKLHRERVTGVIAPCVLAMAALILTHPMAALWLSILLFTFWLGFVVYKRLFKERLATLPVLAAALVFTMAVLGWWAFGSGFLGTLQWMVTRGFDPSSTGFPQAPGGGIPAGAVAPPVGIAPPAAVTPPVGITPPEVPLPPAWETLSGAPLEFLFNSLGMFLFFAVSLIGCFYMLSRRFSNPYAFLMVIAGLVILGIGYFPMLIGLSVIEHRWWYLAQILLSVPLAVAVSLLFGLFKKRYLKAGLVIVLIFVLTFLSIMGLPSNQTNRTFSKNQIVRYAFTASELEALHTVLTNCEGTVAVDVLYTTAARTPRLIELQGKLEGISFLTEDFSQCSSHVILVREEIVKHPIAWGAGVIHKLNYDPRQLLTGEGFSKVYDCGSVSGFVR